MKMEVTQFIITVEYIRIHLFFIFINSLELGMLNEMF